MNFIVVCRDYVTLHNLVDLAMEELDVPIINRDRTKIVDGEHVFKFIGMCDIPHYDEFRFDTWIFEDELRQLLADR